jgi:hypothetical protein
MTEHLHGKGKRDRETQTHKTPAANAASRKKRNTPGSQRADGKNERFAIRGD